MRDPELTREAFVEEMTEALREAGLRGAFDYEPVLGTLVHEDGRGLEVHSLYEKLGALPTDRRLATITKLARALVRGEALPTTWEEARTRLLPAVKTRFSVVMENTRRSPREDEPPRPTGPITEHLVMDMVYEVEGASLDVPTSAYTTWGVSPDTVFDEAAKNLEERSGAQWLGRDDVPGLYRSPWRDGYDASRILFPGLFRRVPCTGNAVAVLPTPSMLLFAGSDDEQGLLRLARAARETAERNGGFHSLRPIRLAEDGVSWEDWLPEAAHPAHGPLRMLRALDQRRDYAHQQAFQQRTAPREPALPGFHALESKEGEILTVTAWIEGAPRPLPKADAIVFGRGSEALGLARWEDVQVAFSDELKPLPTYPPRFLAMDFPEDWQLGQLELRPWSGPLPT